MAGDPSEPKSQVEPPSPQGPPGAEPEPGAPIPADAIDAELLRLPQPGPTRHPGVALAVLLLGVLLLVRMRSDLAYCLQSDTPTAVGEARQAWQAGRLRANRHVTLTGMPDYRNAVVFDVRGGRSRSSLFRLLGNESRVLVVAGDGLPGNSSAPAPTNRFSGRLRLLSELSYADTLRDYYERRAQVLRALDLATLRTPGDKPLPLPMLVRDRAGEMVTLAPQTEVRIQVAFPDDLRVLLLKERFPAESDAAREVARLGLPQGPGVETADGFGYVLRLPAGAARHQAIRQVDARGFYYQARVETYRAPASVLVPTAAGLRLPGPGALPQPVRYELPGVEGQAAPAGQRLTPQRGESTVLAWENIEAVLLSAPLRPPADALVLVTGETPGSLRLWCVPLAVLLLLFMGFNLWYLTSALRRPAEPS